MKLKKEELHAFKSLLDSLPFDRIEGSKCTIVFPIDDETKIDNDGIEMLTKSEFGSSEKVVPALTMNNKLVYINPVFAKKFDMLGYCSLLKKHISSKAEKALLEHDCFLIETDYVLIGFDF